MTTRHRLHIVRSSITVALFAVTASVGLTPPRPLPLPTAD